VLSLILDGNTRPEGLLKPSEVSRGMRMPRRASASTNRLFIDLYRDVPQSISGGWASKGTFCRHKNPPLEVSNLIKKCCPRCLATYFLLLFIGSIHHFLLVDTVGYFPPTPHPSYPALPVASRSGMVLPARKGTSSP
jgi:hypothetical protein